MLIGYIALAVVTASLGYLNYRLRSCLFRLIEKNQTLTNDLELTHMLLAHKDSKIQQLHDQVFALKDSNADLETSLNLALDDSLRHG